MSNEKAGKDLDDQLLGQMRQDFLEEGADKLEAGSVDPRELLSIYRESYDQLAALKHIVYSSVHLSDPASLATVFSKQIEKRMSALGNAVWLVKDKEKVVEIARNGRLVKESEYRFFEIESSEVLKRVIHDQLVVWSSSHPQVKEMLPEFESPTLFPIKAQPQAFGFLVVDPEELAEVEVYQFVGQFAAMILNISELHHKVEEQRKELNEMTEILFRQNAQLASLYHVELALMEVSDPAHLCRIVVDAVVGGLEALRAAAFLVDESSQELVGTAESGGLRGIEALRLPIEQEKAIRHSIESGRVVTYVDNPEKLILGPNILENWIVLPFKGRERPHGVLVAEVNDVDIGDSISILVNHAAILLHNLSLQWKLGKATTRRQ